MYRSHTCGELRASDIGKTVTLAGWVHRIRNFGSMTFIELRDRYGRTQLVAYETSPQPVREALQGIGREHVIAVTGTVAERSSKNPAMDTGEIEVVISGIEILGRSETPPFTIEECSDGGDELRMKYRYLDLRRPPLQRALILRHEMARRVREFLGGEGFLEIETPFLIKSTPEGARDFIVPSRMNAGEFYALPQSPQTFKQLLMVAGYDRYFQIVRCFRDEDLRADRQPEFTQIDCEMAFAERDDVLSTFENMAKYLFRTVLGMELDYDFPRMSWHDAMERYGTDKPDIRFGMEITDITGEAKDRGFVVFDSAEYVGCIVAKDCAGYTRKQTDELTEFVKRPQIGAKGLVWVKFEQDGSVKSSADKFFSPDDFRKWGGRTGAGAGDLMLIIAGEKTGSLNALSELRLELGTRLGLREKGRFAPLWVVDFPLLEWDAESGRFFAMHHPFTSPKKEDIHLFDTDPGRVRANAYDFVVNGVEIGGGSVRIHDSALQSRMFEVLGFTPEEAEKQFGFLLSAFKYGAPPHAGIAYGFDRWCALFGGSESIRDFIAFPKNTSGRDVMLDAPAPVSGAQLKELHLSVTVPAPSETQE